MLTVFFRRTAVICDTTLLLTADREQISVLSQQLHFGLEVVICFLSLMWIRSDAF